MMADLAAEKTHGVTREADVTAVQLDNYSSPFVQGLGVEYFVDALAQIVDDREGKHNTAVVVISVGAAPGKDNMKRWDAFTDAVHELMVHLDSLSVSLVAAAPNKETCAAKGTCPCIITDLSHKHYISNTIALEEELSMMDLTSLAKKTATIG